MKNKNKIKKIIKPIMEVFTVLFWTGFIMIFNFMFMISLASWFRYAENPILSTIEKSKMIFVGNFMAYTWAFVVITATFYLFIKYIYKFNTKK